MSATEKLEALLSRVQANREKPRGAVVAPPAVFTKAVPRVAEQSLPSVIIEEDDEPIITTDVMDPSQDPDMLEVVNDEFEHAPTGETNVIPPSVRPSAPSAALVSGAEANPISIPVSVPPPAISSIEPTQFAAVQPRMTEPDTTPPPAPIAEPIAVAPLQLKSAPVARVVAARPPVEAPATFGKLVARSLALRPR